MLVCPRLQSEKAIATLPGNTSLRVAFPDTIDPENDIATALPVNSMSGLVGGLVVRTARSLASVDPMFDDGAETPEYVDGATLTLLRLTLGSEALAERGVQRGASTYRMASVPISNPERPGTMCTATSQPGGFFCLPFTCHDDSRVMSQVHSGSSADLRVGLMHGDGTRFSALRTVTVRDFRMVPGGQALRPMLQELLSPVDTLSGTLQDQLMARVGEWTEVTSAMQDFIEGGARIAGLIAGTTVPGARSLLLKLVIVAI